MKGNRKMRKANFIPNFLETISSNSSVFNFYFLILCNLYLCPQLLRFISNFTYYKADFHLTCLLIVPQIW